VGIAIKEGYIDGVDHRVLGFFPERTVANSDARKQAMTLEHLLTMTSGLDWPELSVSYSSSSNVNAQMAQSQDWVQFVLDRPMVEEPGTTFNYNTGGSHLLSAIIQETTGMNALSFAQAHLFEPLGISDVSWSSDPDGISYGGNGILMTPRDMAKFGYLYLKGGIWDGQQVVPADWGEASVTRHVEASVNIIPYYGYQWWVRSDGAYTAFGYGGQYILVIPDLQMVVVFTSGLKRVDFGLPQSLVDDFIIPAAKSSEPLPENPQGVALLESRINEVERP
jgi:CubicO group peptidase (beta-lactamase class C family)